MISRNEEPPRPERVTTSFSVDQGQPKPPKGFHLEGAMLSDSPFAKPNLDYEARRLIDTGRRDTPDPERVAEALHEGAFLREEVDL